MADEMDQVVAALFPWAVVDREGQGPIGVCGELEQAMQRVESALMDSAPGALGSVSLIPLNVLISLKFPPERLVRVAVVDSETGKVLWENR